MEPSKSDPLAMVNGAPARSRSNWVVQKFGGTSVGKFCLNIIDQIIL
jgi:aspartate kinase